MYQREYRAKTRPSRSYYARDIIDKAIHHGSKLADEDAMVAGEQWTYASGSGSS